MVMGLQVALDMRRCADEYFRVRLEITGHGPARGTVRAISSQAMGGLAWGGVGGAVSGRSVELIPGRLYEKGADERLVMSMRTRLTGGDSLT